MIDLPTPRVVIAGIAPIPDGRWMQPPARNLIDDFNGFLRGKRYVIHDWDQLCTKQFRELLQPADITPVRLPPRSPNLNAYAERFVRSIESEYLIGKVILGERHLRCAITEFVDHYQPKRPHQGLGNRLIDRVAEPKRQAWSSDTNAWVGCSVPTTVDAA